MTRLVLAGLVTGLVDGLWAIALSLWNHRPVIKLWQYVASVPFGKGMLEGGYGAALVGIALHFVVAFTWCAVFFLLVSRSSWLREVISSPAGVLSVGAIYGPLIWIVMSIVVIPILAHRPFAISAGWWIQLAGHALFVGLPIVGMIGRGRG